MNMMIFFVGGVSAGWISYKLYQVFFAPKAESKQSIKDNKPQGEINSIKKEKASEATDDSKENTQASIKQTNKVDDLSKLKGVGPKLSTALEEIGIYNYEQLYTAPLDELLTKLKKTGGKFNKSALSAIIERAKLASE